MLGKNIEKAFNEQINWELYSGYLYLAMSAYFLSINLNGFASWMRVQALEEGTHAMKFFDFINERSGRVELLALKAPQKEWESPLAAFQDAYEHECLVSGRINDLVNDLGDLVIRRGHPRASLGLIPQAIGRGDGQHQHHKRQVAVHARLGLLREPAGQPPELLTVAKQAILNPTAVVVAVDHRPRVADGGIGQVHAFTIRLRRPADIGSGAKQHRHPDGI